MLIDLDKREAAVKDLESLIPTIRGRRKTIEQIWLNIHAAWKGTFTKSFFKSEVFAHYVPIFRKNIEKRAVRGAQMLLPTNEFFEVYPTDELSEANSKEASSVFSYLQWLVRTKIRSYSMAKQLFRCWDLYGRAITKTGVAVTTEGGQQVVWPMSRAVDPFQFFSWPETQTDLSKCSIVFEDFIIPYDEYKDSVQTKGVEDVDESKLTGVIWPSHMTQRLANSSIPEPHSTTPGDSTQVEGEKPKTSAFVQGSEVWVNYGSYWRFSWIVWNLEGGAKITRVSKTRFQRPAYRMTIAREIPGEQFTSSLGEDGEHLQILTNDAINMFMESTAMDIAGPVAIDPMQVPRSGGLQFRPRAKWLVPPNSIAPVFPFQRTSTRSSLSFAQFSMGLFESFGSSGGPLAEGQPVRNMPRAGFAVSSMLNMSMADIRDAAKSLEDDLFTPMLNDLYALTVEFVPANQLIHIPGTHDFPAKTLRRSDLEGNWSFIWVGSIQAQDYQEKSQRLVSLLSILSKLLPVIGPQLQAQGKQINWLLLFKRIWREGLGERGIENVIQDIPQGQSAPVPAVDTDASASGPSGITPADMEALAALLDKGGMLEPAK